MLLPLRRQSEIEWHLLHLLNERGHIATQTAYRALAERLRLTPKELAVVVEAERPESAWCYECRQAMRRLRDQGYAAPPPPIGIWTITPKGRQVAKSRLLEYNRSTTTLSAEELGI